ncbi:protein FAM221B isoform X2 [Monodelphis domestica]|uniref:protein FAM221B isoform X2 n=1 Tax=Monodelphis domestica TaxID=13616 RepID=UPI000443361A|nr:protein FAM221B isoform X2 [Monodelphis domestica]
MDADKIPEEPTSINNEAATPDFAVEVPTSSESFTQEKALHAGESLIYDESVTSSFSSVVVGKPSEVHSDKKKEETLNAEEFKSPVESTLPSTHFLPTKTHQSIEESKVKERQHKESITNDHPHPTHRPSQGKKTSKKSSPRLYIGWRCPHYLWDCYRIGSESKCFCGHLLTQHRMASDISVPCTMNGCRCQMFCFIPSRPEEVGEFWLQKRSGFDPKTWRALCRCKHNHEEHSPTGAHACRHRGCQCNFFQSNFLCAACDRRWEEHETFFESEETRRQRGRTSGEKSRSSKGAVQ